MILPGLTAGTALLGVAAFGSILATALLFYEYAAEAATAPRLTEAVAGVTTLSLSLALALLTAQFLTGDYSNAYVWENTANYLPVLYKVTGVYASNQGSILLWALLASAVATWTVVAGGFGGRGARLVQALAMGVVSVFAVMLVTESPFTPIARALPDVAANGIPQDGSGLNPLLVDPFMAIHPPITFSAYALLVVPFALGVTHFVSKLRGHESVFEEWIESTTRWLRGSWLLLTAAITLGGVWAYRVLGWGGFWSWDPVETAVLIPWLGLTAVVHTLNRYRTTGSYPVLAPAATAVLFPLVVYATTVVRSGVFRSVHSFASGGIGGGVLVLLVATAALALGPALAYWFLQGGGESEGGMGSLLERATVFHAAVLAFVALAFVSLWGLSFPVIRNVASGVEVSVESQYYNLWSYPLVVFALLTGGAYAQLDVTGERAAAATVAGVGALTLLVAVLAAPPEWQLAATEPYDPLYYRAVGSLSVLSILPPAAYFGLSWVGRYASRVRRIRSRQVRLKETGVVLIHAGAAVAVVAVSLIYVFSTTASVGVVGVTELGENGTEVREVENTPYTVAVTDYSTQNTPTVLEAALSPAEVLETDGSGVLVRGRITATETFENATIAQLDGSSVWLAADRGAVEFESGAEVVARGSLFDPRSENIDSLVYTDAENFGTAADPPEGVHRPRVVEHRMGVELYRNGDLVTEGVVAEQTYSGTDMSTNDVLIDRGLLGDTYVVGTMSSTGASIRVSRFPLANQIWFGIIMMLVGMAALFVFDPAAGVR